ncbi:ATP-binding cassette domain-containing protein [Roseiconus nitratireducens]|uniref:ATP-binding cassette domain-containing protein n=1 Tax=Roseiconus nitratireducens TaxID=2605748 RepID=A0A5M6DF50_9BACT|nr:ATP-binding cassette domain-containing protein [Roseiconus nitratireducens]KAA5546108.1 ATP-binding cassette domain-containing protein [Roseiconus nitratireducens]
MLERTANHSDPTPGPSRQEIVKAIERLGIALAVNVSLKELSGDSDETDNHLDDVADPLDDLFALAEHSGIFIKETELHSVADTMAMVRQGFPIVIAPDDGRLIVMEHAEGRKIECSVIGSTVEQRWVNRRGLKKLLGDPSAVRMMVAKKELECDSLSDSPGEHSAGHPHDHPTPFRRFVSLLALDKRDLGLIVIFALVAGVLALASPLVVESLVNVVSWGTYFQPLVVLAGMLLVCLGLAGVLRVLQTVVVELIQRRQFVRIVSDLAHRFPRASQSALRGEYPRELANRVFDIMTIQKATAVLLLDGLSIVLTTVLGLVLLAFYHPFLLGFDIVLIITMLSFTWILGRGGVRTAIGESITKYRVAHWLQDVIASPAAFKTGGGEALAIQRANQLTTDYLSARQSQFAVVIRQVIFAVSLQVLASTALLGLGGWLVIQGQLTLGQLVASELVVTVVVGAFAKAGKSLEKFYDLMAGIDKVGHLLDIPADPRVSVTHPPDGPAELTWGPLHFRGPAIHSRVGPASIAPGTRVAIVGDDTAGKTMLAKAIAGLLEPDEGLVQVAGYDATHAAIGGQGSVVAYAGECGIFHGTLAENVDLGRAGIGQRQIRDALTQVGLSKVILRLREGLRTRLQTGGYPLSGQQISQLILARSVVSDPKVLVVDGLLDGLDDQTRAEVWQGLVRDDAPWTLVLVTNRKDVADLCDSRISVRNT